MMHGKGFLVFKHDQSQGSYKGDFKMNKFHGNGKLCLNDLTITGEWLYSQSHGSCEIISQNITFKGKFLKGVIDGQGSLYFSDGSCYLGDWENGKIFGSGQAQDSNGYSISAYFMDAVPVVTHKLNQQFFISIKKFQKKLKKIQDTLNWINKHLLIKNQNFTL